MGALALIAVLLTAGPKPAESSVSFDAATAAFVADSGFVVLAAGTPVGLHVRAAAGGDALFFDLVRVGPMGAPGPLTLRVRVGAEAAAGNVTALTVKTPVRIERKLAAGPGGSEVYASNPARHRLALPPGDTQVVLVADGDGAVRIRIGRTRARARAARVSAGAAPAGEDPLVVGAQPASSATADERGGGAAEAHDGVAAASAAPLLDATPPDATTEPATTGSAAAQPAAPGEDLAEPDHTTMPAVSPPPPEATAAVEPLDQEPAPGRSVALPPTPERTPAPAVAPRAVVAPVAAPAGAIAVSGDVRIGVRGLWSGLQPVAPMGAARVLFGSRHVSAGLAVDFDLSHADVEVPQASWDAAGTQVRVEARLQSPTALQIGALALTPAIVVGLGGRAVAHSIVTALPSARALHVWQLGAAGRMEAEVSTPLGPGVVVLSVPVDVAADPFGPVAGFVPLAAGILVGYRLAP